MNAQIDQIRQEISAAKEQEALKPVPEVDSLNRRFREMDDALERRLDEMRGVQGRAEVRLNIHERQLDAQGREIGEINQQLQTSTREIRDHQAEWYEQSKEILAQQDMLNARFREGFNKLDAGFLGLDTRVGGLSTEVGMLRGEASRDRDILTDLAGVELPEKNQCSPATTSPMPTRGELKINKISLFSG